MNRREEILARMFTIESMPSAAVEAIQLLQDQESDIKDIVRTIEFDPSWSVFFNAGRGWALAEAGPGFVGQDTETYMDVGFGIFLGDLGLYFAFPIEDDEDRGGNFFIRLTHRF